ncbi:putative ice nucleation protein [Rosellinia necatrix]|uniref:Crh-like protein n=1 Tax=Rosellinia necatrix TaxID=77044 RepID=A0A1W2TJG7_ROSNE|nr:putative ice nucleation protein [Rosellinia necatrix]
MFSKVLSATAVALAASQLVSAQTFTACDPREKSCPPDPAIGKEKAVVIDFTQGKNSFFTAAEGTTITYDGKGAAFTMKKETEAPTVTSSKYLFFGKVDVEVEVAPGVGIVTSVVLQSDDRDEIDWEWLGGDSAQVQTNYFGKGDDSTFDRGGYSPVSNPQTTTHTYTIDWTKDYVHWIIDGTLVRELKYADAKGGSRFPQTPCQLKLGTWVAGNSKAPEGTVQWAGGLADFSKGPFTAYYKKVTIQDYANGVANAKQYVWADGSDGSYQSINVETTDGKDSGDETTTSTTAKPTTTKASSTSTKDDATISVTKTASTTASSAETSSADSSNGSGSQTSDSATPTGSGEASTSESASSSSTPVPTGAAFKPAFSGAMVGAGLLAALAL